MTFTVAWVPTAERKLAELWNSATNRLAITAAADTIDFLLRSDPLNVGESREGTQRILVWYPLAVYYDVSESDRLVTISSVWRSAD